jgi:hypothetical protein
MSSRTLLTATLISCAALQACTQAPDLAKVQADVAKAQADGQKMIVDAQANLDKVNAQNNKDVVNAQVDHPNDAMAAAPAGNPPEPTATEKARHDASDKVADAQYDVDKAKGEAAYNVQVAQCGAQMGDALKACKETAKASYDSALSNAKAKDDASHQANRPPNR